MAHGIGALQELKIIPVASDAEVDPSGFEGVLFVCVFDAAAGSNEMQGKQGPTGSLSDLDGAITDMDATATVGCLQIHKPLQSAGDRVACELTGAGSMVAILYGPRSQEVAQDAATTIAANYISPDVA